MRRFPQCLPCLLAACLLAAPGAEAQQRPGTTAPAAAQPAVPRYRVEIILFANTDGDPLEEAFAHENEAARASLADQPMPVPIVPMPNRPDGEDVLAIETFGSNRADSDRLPAGGRAGGAGQGQPGGAGESADPTRVGGGAIGPDGLPIAADDPFEFVDPFGRLSVAAPGARAVRSPGLPPGFRPLRPDEYQLDDAAAVIDRLGAYRPLGHAGWVQEGLDENEAVPLDVAYLGITNPRGSLKLYLGRFLHMAVDLEYERDEVPALANGALPNAFRAGLGEIERPRIYRLQTERNAFRSGELHYIDHPLFGMLMIVTPVPEEEDEDVTASGVEPAA